MFVARQFIWIDVALLLVLSGEKNFKFPGLIYGNNKKYVAQTSG